MKVFLYLYPIEEYMRMFMFYNDKMYDTEGIERPLPILNETIDKRYRKNGYQIVYALYPDKKMFGIEKQENDKIIYTDITFSQASAIDEKGNIKQNFIPKYPDELYLLNQLGNVEELVVGGFHSTDCVKKVAEVALQNNIDTLVDLDLTDLFFNLYRRENYFNKEIYDPTRLRQTLINSSVIDTIDENYSSPVYRFNNSKTR